MVDPKGPSAPHAHAYASVTVPSRLESIRLAAEFIVQCAKNMLVPAAAEPMFEVAIVEALNNALEHGNPNGHPEALIVCELEVVNHCLSVRVLGQWQDFTLPPPPEDWSPDAVATIPEGGFGLPIIQEVFPMVRTISRSGRFGLEMVVPF